MVHCLKIFQNHEKLRLTRKNEPNHIGEGIKNVVNHPTSGSMTIGNPADTLTYVRALGLIVGGYGAYKRDKRRETDIAVKEEILRCADRVRTHVENVHDDAYRDGNVRLAKFPPSFQLRIEKALSL